MAFPTTTAGEIREQLGALIQRIIPREESRRDERWVWRKSQEIAGRTRNFDLLMGPEIETGDGPYGEGIQYTLSLTIRASYQADEEEMRRLVGSDGQDLAALLVQLHEYITEGMFPVELGALGGPILQPVILADEEGNYIIDYIADRAIKFFASDVVSLDSE